MPRGQLAAAPPDELVAITETKASQIRQARPIVIDLFAGAGGLSLGFEMAGFDVVSAIEYDPVHAAIHLYNFPKTDLLCVDVTKATREMVLASARRGWQAHNPDLPCGDWDETIDVLIGGPSCQGFSVMGKQDVDDSRNLLVLQFVRLVEELKPRAFCMENVPGFLHDQFAPLRESALQRLRDAGYTISGHDTVLKAVDYGVPQRRRRVVITGALDGKLVAAPKKIVNRETTVSDALLGLPDIGSYPTATIGDRIELNSSDQLRRASATNSYLDLGDILGDGSGTFGHARAHKIHELTGCKSTAHKPESVVRFGATPQGSVERVSRAYRLSETRAANTLRAGTGRERGAFSASRPLHPLQPRVIVVREAARLHSFPDWFRFHSTNWHGHRQVGNAVPPLLAAAVAATLMNALGMTPSKSTLPPMTLGEEFLRSTSPTEAAKLLSVEPDQIPKRARPLLMNMSKNPSSKHPAV